MPATPPADASQIQLEMQQVRAELRNDVREMVSNAQDMVDAAWVLTQWQTYVRRYPWACAAAAAAAGYLVVPSRPKILRPDTESLMELAKQKKLVVQMNTPATPQPSMVKSLIGMAAGTALQFGMAFASKHLNQFLAAAVQPPKHSSRPPEGVYRD